MAKRLFPKEKVSRKVAVKVAVVGLVPTKCPEVAQSLLVEKDFSQLSLWDESAL